MLFVSQLVSINVESKILMTEWQDDRILGVTKWLSYQVTKWRSDGVTEWRSDQVTKWRSYQVTERLNDWVTGSFADRMVYLIVQPGDYLCMSVIESFKASVSWICRIENLKIMCELRVHLRAPKCNRILSLVVKHWKVKIFTRCNRLWKTWNIGSSLK